MSTFEVKAYRVEVEPHPNADRLDIIRCEGQQFICIAQRGLYQNGDVALYVPTDALIPEYLLKPGFWDETKGKGMLSGSLGNRVKPKRLRGIFSEGILFKCKFDRINDNGTNYYTFEYDKPEEDTILHATINIPLENQEEGFEFYLGITKYEPTIPAHMRGKMIGEFQHLTIKYDFDSIKKDPDMFYERKIETVEYVPEGSRTICYKEIGVPNLDKPDSVWISEKVHGTLLMTGIAALDYRNEKFYKEKIYFSSKGVGARGIVLDHNDEANVYVRAMKKFDLFDRLANIPWIRPNESLLIFSEVFGSGVQDLTYGASSGDLFLRVFDAAIVRRHEDYEFLELDQLKKLCQDLDVPMVPILYEGPYDPKILAELTDGLETVSGTSAHIREGVVQKSVKNFLDVRNNRWYRKAAKSVSEAYHERKGNQTDFQ